MIWHLCASSFQQILNKKHSQIFGGVLCFIPLLAQIGNQLFAV